MSGDLAQYVALLEEEYRREMTGNLAEYCRFMWDVVEPRRPFVPGWHIDAICDHLEAVSRHEIENLVISMPPRHMKSLCVSVFWPSWVWTWRPESRWIFSSYSKSLSTRDSVKARRLILHPKYRETFKPGWSLDMGQNQKTRFNNTALGYRVTTSVGGSGTGEGGDFIVVDDPLKATDGHSEVKRDFVQTWWDEEMSNRANDPKKVGRVIVMQRLHDKDLAGHVMRSGDWQELRLPAEYTGKSSVTVLGWKDPREKVGELLWPDRFDAEWIVKEKKKLGSMAASAQLQQEPLAAEGGLFQRKWWRRYTEQPTVGTLGIFVDSAQKPGITNDYTVISVWLKTPNGIYKIDQIREKLAFPQLKQTVRDVFRKWNAKIRVSALVIEDKASGISLIQDLQNDEATMTWPIFAYSPGQRDKQTRAAAATPTVQAGNCYLPEAAPWVEDHISEHEKFPLGEHDDIVDTTSMMVDFFSTFQGAQARVRSL